MDFVKTLEKELFLGVFYGEIKFGNQRVTVGSVIARALSTTGKLTENINNAYYNIDIKRTKSALSAASSPPS
eukprot:1195740-Prorocentrum_minimum.AAC.2